MTCHPLSIRLERRERLAALQHLTASEAAREMGVTRPAVEAMARRWGFRFRSGRTSPEVYRELQHLTVAEAAARVGVAQQTVRSMAARHGFSFREAPPVRMKVAGTRAGAVLAAKLFEIGHRLPPALEERFGRLMKRSISGA